MNRDKEHEKKVIENIAKQIRRVMELRHGTGTDLCGHCVEASDLIVRSLTAAGIFARTVEGWCVYDDDSTCSDRCYDEHTWVIAGLDGYYVDVTADQFNSLLEEPQSGIIVSADMPYCMKTDRPDYLWLEERI